MEIEAGHVFPEEEEAFDRICFLSWVMPVIVIVSSLIDLGMVFYFQKYLHPWRRILSEVKIFFEFYPVPQGKCCFN